MSDFAQASGLRPYDYVRQVDRVFGALIRDGNLLVCHVCGRSFRSLAVHIRRTHMTVSEYKAEFGLNEGTGLVSPDLSARFSEVGKRSDVATGKVRPKAGVPSVWKGKKRTYRLERQIAQRERARKQGLARRGQPNPRKPWTARLDTASVLARYAGGETAAAIARDLGWSRDAIMDLIVREGPPGIRDTHAVARKAAIATCKRGHPWAENEMPLATGGRRCRACYVLTHNGGFPRERLPE